MGKYRIRLGTEEDIMDIVKLRRLMFEDMGVTSVDDLGMADEACHAYLEQKIPLGEFISWVVEGEEKEIVGTAGLVVDQHPPGPNNLTGQIAYVMNLVITENHRRRGLARQLMSIVEEYAQTNGINVVSLHASEKGRPLYEKMGYVSSNEMKKKLIP